MKETQIEFNQQQVEVICGCAAAQTLSNIHPSSHQEYAVQFERMSIELLEIFDDLVKTGEGDPRMVAHQISRKSPAKIAAMLGFINAYVPCANENGINVPDPFALPSQEPLTDEEAGDALEKLLDRRD